MSVLRFAASDPMHQFVVQSLVPLQIGATTLDFTNATFWKFVIVAVVVGLLLAATRSKDLVPTRLQAFVEMIYEFIRNTVRSTIGEDGMAFFPLIFTIFAFVLTANLLGMFPYGFTVTSHISVTFALALFVFAIVLIVGFQRQGIGFFARFYPSSAPWWLGWFIMIIEIISFLIRPVTLGVRLFANMLAGHTMLKVLAGFIPAGLTALAAGGVLGAIGAVGALTMNVGVTALEFLVAGIQAYIFTILTCIYLSEVVHDPHH